MARHIKTGLDYFSHNCGNDIKLEYLEAEHGLIGYAVFFKLLELIYFENGYFIEYNEKFVKLFAKRNNTEAQIIEDITTTCLEEGLFNKDIFKKYGVLTSSGIQKRFTDATIKRKQNNVKKEYNLIDYELTPINSEETPINSELSTQSKVKESKVNKTKVNKSKGDAAADQLSFSELINFSEFKNEFENNISWVNGIVLEFETLKTKITPEEIPKLLKRFGIAQITLQHPGWSTKKDFAAHFKNWLKIHIKNNKNGNQNTNNSFNGRKQTASVSQLEALKRSRRN